MVAAIFLSAFAPAFAARIVDAYIHRAGNQNASGRYGLHYADLSGRAGRWAVPVFMHHMQLYDIVDIVPGLQEAYDIRSVNRLSEGQLFVLADGPWRQEISDIDLQLLFIIYFIFARQ